MDSEKSFKEQRIRSITQLYYSKPEIQKIIFEFSKNREICPRYFESFGKRPDSFQYPGDIFEMVKKGATSFHCSEELWSDAMAIETGMTEKQLNNLRTGWDLIIDIDSKYIDYSKIYAKLILDVMKFHGVKNVGVKFSGSKGFHLIIPWKAFPKEINGIKTSDLFPHLPRVVVNYLLEKTKKQIVEKISELERPNKYVKDFRASKEVIPDLILVSPRHLFRMPYSLHEKTALASVVLTEEELDNFDFKLANPLALKPRNFIPDCREGEASNLIREALDWNKDNEISSGKSETKARGQFADFKQIKLINLNESQFPPCIQNILKGVSDGKKRSTFALINFFRSIGMEKEDMEKKLEEWNKKNEVPLKDSYIKTQLIWAYKRKPLMPPNCREFYQGIGVCKPDVSCSRTKNPVNYVIKKNLSQNSNKFKNKE